MNSSASEGTAYPPEPASNTGLQQEESCSDTQERPAVSARGMKKPRAGLQAAGSALGFLQRPEALLQGLGLLDVQQK